ncbi:MAG: acetylxylan esterase [Oligoflexus sp.]|nr:acetylxylan esterase [Pseudopedobacter sp.]
MLASVKAQTLEESEVPKYTLPALTILNNGKDVKTAKVWESKRRDEIISLLKNEMYGIMPKKPKRMVFKVFDMDSTAINGKATRKQVRVIFDKKADSIFMDILIYIPNKIKQPVPLILGLNFAGNQEALNDPKIKITESWVSKKSKGAIKNKATEASRGNAEDVFPIERMIDEGYAAATIYAGDIDPDYLDLNNAVQSLYPKLQNRKDNFSTIGAWAWGLSRAMDYFEKDKQVDEKRVVLTGLSRLGKAALWAGALDQRFAMVISTESGKGGDALFKREFGESVDRITKVFPQWFCLNFDKYANNVSQMPFDQHMVLALVAPRPLYIGTAIEDLNEDPKGEFLSLKAAELVYKLFGFNGLPINQLPKVNQPIQTDKLGFHIREGKHGITAYDWHNYFVFIKSRL